MATIWDTLGDWGLTGYQGVPVHTGSTQLFGFIPTPDFGATEARADKLGYVRDGKGGSENSATIQNNWANTDKNIAQAQMTSISPGGSNYISPATTTTNNIPTQQPTNDPLSGFSMSYYPGWDENAARQDWIATGGAKGRTAQLSGPSASDLALSASRNAFDSAYNPIYSQLDSMIANIPNYQANREQQVNDLYGSQYNEITGARDNSISALDSSRQNVAIKQAQSVRDLQENMRNMLQAGNIQLGVRGAGDSSAAQMYAYALSKQAGRGSADISNQSMSQYGQIDAQAQQIRAVADDNFNKLGTWKITSINSVKDWALNQVQNLEGLKLNATAEKARAIASNQVNIINQALSNLQNIDAQVSQWKQGINNWALERLATIDNYKLQVGQLGKYNASDIVAGELKGMNGTTSGVSSSANMVGYNPWSAQKKEYTDFLSNYAR